MSGDRIEYAAPSKGEYAEEEAACRRKPEVGMQGSEQGGGDRQRSQLTGQASKVEPLQKVAAEEHFLNERDKKNGAEKPEQNPGYDCGLRRRSENVRNRKRRAARLYSEPDQRNECSAKGRAAPTVPISAR